jgi:hypothetical protein
MKPCKSLIQFRDTTCPDLPLDSPKLFFCLIDEKRDSVDKRSEDYKNKLL